jgi:hypothetical protein
MGDGCSVYVRLTRCFFNIFELNFQSIKNAAAKDLNSGDLRPHYVRVILGIMVT